MFRKLVIISLVINPVLSQNNFWSLYRTLNTGSSCVSEVVAFARHTEVTSQIECLGLCSRDERCVRTKYNESALVCELFGSNESCENNFGNTDYEKVISL